MVYQTGILYYKNRAGERVGPVLPDSKYGETYLTVNGMIRWFGPKHYIGSWSGRVNGDHDHQTI